MWEVPKEACGYTIIGLTQVHRIQVQCRKKDIELGACSTSKNHANISNSNIYNCLWCARHSSNLSELNCFS